jgi:hypothetical protein
MLKLKHVVLLITFLSINSNIKYTPVSSQDIMVNTYTGDDQTWPQVTTIDNDFWVGIWWWNIWGNDDVRAQIFNKKGEKVGNEFSPATITDNVQIKPFATSIGNGKFVLIWNDYDGWTRNTAKARIFDTDGNPVTDEIICNDYVYGLGDWLYVKGFGDPASGNFVVTWQVNPNEFQVRASFLDVSGAITTKDIVVNGNDNGDQSCGFPCFLSNGNVVIVYHSDENGTYDVFFKIYDSTGSTVLKSDTIANYYTEGGQNMSQCAGLTGGGFVVYFKTNYWGNNVDFAFRLFDSNGDPVTNEDTKVNTAGGVDNWTTVRTLPNGGFWLFTMSGNLITRMVTLLFKSSLMTGVLFSLKQMHLSTDQELKV